MSKFTFCHALMCLTLACGPVPISDMARPSDDETSGSESGGEGKGTTEARESLSTPTLVTRKSESPVLVFRVVFDAGSAEDPKGLEGVTHLAARLMVEGGAGELSYKELTERLYPMAATLDVHTGRDQTVFVGRVHRDHLDTFYPIFRDVLSAPRMGKDDFARIRDQARNALEVELRGNDDEELGKEALQAMLYEGHPFGHPALGTERGLSALSLEDVKQQRRRVFCGGRATVGVAGALPDGFADKVRTDVEALVFEECVGRRVLPPPPEPKAPEVLLVDRDDAQAVAISMGMHIDVSRTDPDYPALVLAAAYLGQHRQFVGRLMQEMRGERGLNYGDYAYAEYFEQEGWSRFPLANAARRQQYFSIWIRPVNPEQAHFAVRMAVRELRKFVDEGISDRDFERVRTFVERYYALYLQTESRRLGYDLDDEFYGAEAAWLPRLRGAWKTLTAPMVNQAIKKHIHPDKLRVAIVHPDAEKFAEVLSEEAPSPIEYRATPKEEILVADKEIIPYKIGIPRDRMRVVPVSEMFK